MDRWGALAGQLRGDAVEDRPPSLEEFLEENHRLFTSIGMFGALSVYLMEFQKTIAGATGGPVGAILLLFLLTSFVAIRNSYRCTDRARKHGEYLLVFGYAIFMYSFVTLVVSVVFVIVGRYAQGAENVLSSSFVYALVFVYVPFIFRADAFREFDGAPAVSRAVRGCPYVAAVLLAGWHAAQWGTDGLPALELDSAAYAIGIVLSLVGHHFVITVAVFGLLWGANEVVTSVRG